MRRRAVWGFAAGASVAIVFAAAGFVGAFDRSSAQARSTAAPIDQEIAKLQQKLKAFATVGGQASDIRNLGDLQRAIEIEAAHIERGGGGMMPTRPEDIERLNAKLDLFRALGGNPATLDGVRASLRQAIEAELQQLRRNEGG